MSIKEGAFVGVSVSLLSGNRDLARNVFAKAAAEHMARPWSDGLA